jgi:hypothetical protein
MIGSNILFLISGIRRRTPMLDRIISAPSAAMRVGCFFERLGHPLALSGERDNQDNPRVGME